MESTTGEVTISNMQVEHWPSVLQIYKEGIESGIATFEKNLPSYEDWDKGHLKNCRLVAILNEEIVGWIALSSVSSRCVYGGVAELSVYVRSGFRGKQIGAKLMKKLIASSVQHNIWTLQSGIFPENTASIRLHLKMGFREIGFREKIAKLDGIWKDNLIFERRSRVVGID